MTIDDLIQHYSTPIEQELEALLDSRDGDLALYDMIRYQFGWADREGRPVAASDRPRFGGKKLRGALCLLAAEAVSGGFERAVPAAAALEMLHNFSLVHDDIEDGDAERRHRPTVWKLWGVPQAINTGSAMQALLSIAGLRVSGRGVDAAQALRLIELLNVTVLRLTEGQHLDIGFQDRESIGLAEYLRMASLKTGALLEAALGGGALLGGADERVQKLYAAFAMDFGLAYQARDDYLGIWGDPARTGKPVGSDILARKKSLPLCRAMERAEGADRERLAAAIAEGDVPTVMTALDTFDVKSYTDRVVSDYTEAARAALEETGMTGPAQDGIWRIAEYALGRER